MRFCAKCGGRGRGCRGRIRSRDGWPLRPQQRPPCHRRRRRRRARAGRHMHPGWPGAPGRDGRAWRRNAWMQRLGCPRRRGVGCAAWEASESQCLPFRHTHSARFVTAATILLAARESQWFLRRRWLAIVWWEHARGRVEPDRARRQPGGAAPDGVGVGGADLYRPAVQYRAAADSAADEDGAGRGGRPGGLRRGGGSHGGGGRRLRMKTGGDEAGDRVGCGGRRYRTELVNGGSGAGEAGSGKTGGYADRFDDFLGFLRPRLVEAHRVLAPTGSLFFHIDYREVHYCKVMLDQIFGRESFQNEIIWAYDYGARATKRWPAKHDTILWYTRDPERYTFNLEASDRIPYMAPGLVGAEKAARE